MADPITVLSTVVGGLVSVFTAYTQYKSATKRAEDKQELPPAKTDEVMKGEQVAAVVETAIQQHGKPDEQTALAGYQPGLLHLDSNAFLTHFVVSCLVYPTSFSGDMYGSA